METLNTGPLANYQPNMYTGQLIQIEEQLIKFMFKTNMTQDCCNFACRTYY